MFQSKAHLLEFRVADRTRDRQLAVDAVLLHETARGHDALKHNKIQNMGQPVQIKVCE